MSIGINDSLKGGRFAQYQNTNQRSVKNQATSLFDRVGGATVSDSQGRVGQSRLTAYEAYSSMSARSIGKISVSNLGMQVSSNLDKVENDKYTISAYTEGGLEGCWSIYNKETGKYITVDPQYASMQVDPQTGKKYLVQSNMFGGFVDAWGVDSSLEDLMKEFMGIDDIDTIDINENYTLDKDAMTGIVSIKKKGAEGGRASIIIEDEEQQKKLEELANIYLEKYPTLVTSKRSAMIFAMQEVVGTAIRDETGILTIAIGGMGYMNEKDPTKSWGIMYSGNDSSIYSKIKEAFTSGAITGNQIGNYEKWLDWLTEKEIDFELFTTKEALDRLREENYSEWLRITSSLSK